jgi:hypothetical protein
MARPLRTDFSVDNTAWIHGHDSFFFDTTSSILYTFDRFIRITECLNLTLKHERGPPPTLRARLTHWFELNPHLSNYFGIMDEAQLRTSYEQAMSKKQDLPIEILALRVFARFFHHNIFLFKLDDVIAHTVIREICRITSTPFLHMGIMDQDTKRRVIKIYTGRLSPAVKPRSLPVIVFASESYISDDICIPFTREYTFAIDSVELLPDPVLVADKIVVNAHSPDSVSVKQNVYQQPIRDRTVLKAKRTVYHSTKTPQRPAVFGLTAPWSPSVGGVLRIDEVCGHPNQDGSVCLCCAEYDCDGRSFTCITNFPNWKTRKKVITVEIPLDFVDDRAS